MQLIHFGIDYRGQIASIPDHELRQLQISESKFLLPANPVVTGIGAPIRVAFFGYNSACNELDFGDAQKERNVTEWCQANYNPKFKIVMGMWLEGLPYGYMGDGAGYYSNIVKLVLRERFYTRAAQVQTALRSLPETTKLFQMLLRQEVEQLIQQGCRVFVCFGSAAYNFAGTAIGSMNAVLVPERHFSWYRPAHTQCQIADASAKI